MEVVLTHEHADFDAVASLVACAELHHGTVAVLPREVNSNVRRFLADHGESLGLVSGAEMPPGPILRIWLVDTSAAPSLTGVAPDTPREVVDHHAPGPTRVGANVTLLVEELAAAEASLAPPAATLMLLGIHEDTGGLRYSATTARDYQAAAWLMERGADLAAVADYLTEPLTTAGRELLGRLLHAARTVHRDGHRVVIAAADAPDYGGELAPLAGHLVDLLEPDALVMVTGLGDRTQVVARSRSSDVDVGALARVVGGGGHPRAAAAVVEGRSVRETLELLEGAIDTAVAAPVLVRDVMSRGAIRTLVPDTSIAAALALAQRHGHEGYPVVGDDGVLGVVTRTDLDLAARHGLGDEPVNRLLAGPPAAVEPRDSVATVQDLMIEHHVGQVPVVEKGVLVGIVTRTDLLKLWARGGKPQQALRVDLDRAFSPRRRKAVRAIAAAARRLAMKAYVVGGVPRDLLLGAEPRGDVDIVIEGDAIALAHSLVEAHGGRVVAHGRFRTAKWIPADETDALGGIDLVTARREYYEAPSALPGVERGSLASDLRRRDFTINTLAADIDADRYGEVVDLFGAVADLRRGQIRVLHSLSFVEDPTRILRAIRLASRLGFTLEERTERRLRDAVGLLHRVSPARIRTEMLQLFAEDAPEGALLRLEEVGALASIEAGLGGHVEALRSRQVLPALQSAVAARRPRLAGAITPPSAETGLTLWLAAHAMPQLAARLALSRRQAEAVDAVAALTAPGGPADTQDRVALFRRLSRHRLDDCVMAWAAAVHRGPRHGLRSYVLCLAGVRPAISGDDLRDLGCPPGPAYGEILDAVMEAVLLEQAPTRRDQLALARQLIAARRQASR